MFQMRFYALVLWRLRGQVPRLLQVMLLHVGVVEAQAFRRGEMNDRAVRVADGLAQNRILIAEI